MVLEAVPNLEKKIMAFKRKVLQGPDITLRGPSEHEGENRYSWLAPTLLPSQNWNTLYVRACKVRSHEHDKRNDHFSTILSFTFFGDSLHIQLHGTDAVPGHVAPNESVLNVYTNTAQSVWPSFEIPVASLVSDEYHVSTYSNHHGDFLTLIGKLKKDKSVHIIVLNLTALLTMEGLRKLSLEGACYYENEHLGTIPSSSVSVLPFFINVTSKEDFHGYATLRHFSATSHHRTLELMEIDQGVAISRFAVIHHEVFSDRGTIEMEEGVRQAKVAFEKLFL